MIAESRKNIIDLIKSRGTLSIDEAVESTDLAKTTLREHFLQLERNGYVEREYIRSGPGRPKLQYQLTNKGHGIYPSYEGTMMKQLLHYLKEEGKEMTIEAFFEAFWEERFKNAKGRIDEFDESQIQQRIQAFMGMLEEEGFMPEFDLDEEHETLSVKACNCPFGEVVKETRLPCKLEAMFYKKLFGESVERTKHIPEGDYSCSYEIPLKVNQ